MMSSMAPSLPSYTCRLSLTCRRRSSAISSCCCRLLLWEGDWEHAQGWSGWASGSPGLLPEPLTPIHPTNSHPVLSQGWEQPCAGCSRSMEKPGKDKVQLMEIRTIQHSTYLVFLLQTSQAAEHTLELSQPIPAPSIKTSRLFPGNYNSSLGAEVSEHQEHGPTWKLCLCRTFWSCCSINASCSMSFSIKACSCFFLSSFSSSACCL